ncbi:MAG: ABC transporter ATP-binding protein [Peptococcaceae bacterium]|jgi:putative ABC transport system ATP-binding protein|nr:ABC transporter ATP-binding protein [Peptococcaceae bacterium]
MADSQMIRLNQVARTYAMGTVEVRALEGISLDIGQGELLVILGTSGSGKSTLLNVIGGMDQPTAGRIFFRGEDLSRAGDARLTRYRREAVGFVFQFYNLIPDLTAGENVELAAGLVDHPLPVPEVMAAVGLSERMDNFPSQMSGGEQQRVAIARAVVKNPSLLLCDEPTGALDYHTGKAVLSLLAGINRESGTTVVIVTHNSAIGAMGHRVVRMRSGNIVEITTNDTPVPPERIEW